MIEPPYVSGQHGRSSFESSRSEGRAGHITRDQPPQPRPGRRCPASERQTHPPSPPRLFFRSPRVPLHLALPQECSESAGASTIVLAGAYLRTASAVIRQRGGIRVRKAAGTTFCLTRGNTDAKPFWSPQPPRPYSFEGSVTNTCGWLNLQLHGLS